MHQTYDVIREISLKHHHSMCGLFEQGLNKEILVKLLHLHLWL
jgi:hypothetical protein